MTEFRSVPDGWHKPQGIYGEDEQSPYSVRMRPASTLESVRLSSQPEFIYFLPYVPLVLSPGFPDPATEYVYANNLNLTVVYWELDYALVPSLNTDKIGTHMIFGVPRPEGEEFVNFAKGMMRQDAKTNLALRLVVDVLDLVEPTVSRAQPAEKILANRFSVYAFGIQSPRARFVLRTSKDSATCRVVKINQGDPQLWEVMRRLWAGNKDILL